MASNRRRAIFHQFSLASAALSLLLASSAAPADDFPKVTRADVNKVAHEVYIYGYPLVTMEMTRRVMTNTDVPKDAHAPMGQFYHSRTYPNASFRDITAPNADTLYSTAWLDLSKEPYVLSLPEQKDRYYLVPILDAWTNVIQSPGTRTTGDKAQKYAITGPGWSGKLPDGATEIKSPTNLVWILGAPTARARRKTTKQCTPCRISTRWCRSMRMGKAQSSFGPPAKSIRKST